jgi:hypothetical protein
VSTVKIRRVPFNDVHMDQKCLVLEGYIEGMPQLTKRKTIDTAALADGTLTLESERVQLLADVEEYHTRWLAVQQALTEL